MNDRKPPSGDSPYRGPPSGKPRDKRERERDRQARPAPAEAPVRRGPPRDRVSDRDHARHEADADLLRAYSDTPKAPREQRLHGLNACLAMFARRPQDLRKVWLLESRIPQLKAVLAHCVQHRLGYTIVADEDLQKLSASAHHEGVVFGTLPAAEANLSDWLRDLKPGPQLAVWLDGVGNPHNLGAILRSAAHFGVGAVLLPKHSTLALSGAAARVAEGGGEAVPFVRLGREDNSIAQLHGAGFELAATVVRGGSDLFKAALPQRVVYVLGAEAQGMSPDLAKACDLRLSIPGSGAVDSLNVASATAVLLSQWASRAR